VELSHPSLLTQKKSFWKGKNILNLSSPFLKALVKTYNSFNLIELCIPYIHWNPIIIKSPMRKEKKIKLNPFASPKFSPINPTIPLPNFIN
jgi:hypothetical protein